MQAIVIGFRSFCYFNQYCDERVQFNSLISYPPPAPLEGYPKSCLPREFLEKKDVVVKKDSAGPTNSLLLDSKHYHFVLR